MKKVIALDFDGTLCENAWPGIGDPKWAVIRAAQEEQRQGALLILWTTREGPELEQALAWCEYVGLRLDGVNTSAQCWKDAYQNDPRKIGATEYWDDRAVDVATIETRQMLKEETRRRQAAWNTAKESLPGRPLALAALAAQKRGPARVLRLPGRLHSPAQCRGAQALRGRPRSL